MTVPRRKDRHHCWCDRYDSAGIGPHRYDANRCDPGYDSGTIFDEQKPAQKRLFPPTPKRIKEGRFNRMTKKENLVGWICPFCGNTVPMQKKRCDKCNK